MVHTKLRRQQVSDAKRFYEILSNPNFIYWTTKPKSVADERRWLLNNTGKKRKNTDHNFSIICAGCLVGAAGIKIYPHTPYIGEIGYFVDEAYWGKGIAPQAVRILEKIGFSKLGLVRIEIRMNIKNKASEMVAIKAGYKKEGLLRKAFKHGDKYIDEYLYAKVK